MRQPRLLTAVVAFVALLLSSVLLAAGPASAHDAAESSTPANGSTVAGVPEKVSVTFNNRPLGIGSQFLVKDAGGTNWSEGPVEIVDNVASQRLKPGAPAGQYTVSWRVVSSDSHPIEGTFTFTAAAGGGSTAAGGSASAAPSVPVATAGTAQPGSGGGGAGTAGEATPAAAEPFPWSIVGFAAVAIALLVFLGVTARRRLAGEAASDSAGEAESKES